MKRCDYDATFYRVCCVTLLAVALTFTVILTNVFVDIDGFITKHTGKHSTKMSDRTKILSQEVEKTTASPDDLSDEKNRRKRSLDAHNILFHIGNPNIKHMLTKKLANLLEELEEDDTPATVKVETKKAVQRYNDVKLINRVVTKETLRDKNKQEEEMFHAAMHNLLLNGIAGHTDIQDVYTHVLAIAEKLHITQDRAINHNYQELTWNNLKVSKYPSIEDRFLKELTDCKDLHDQVEEQTTVTTTAEDSNAGRNYHNVVIKTIIDITSTPDVKGRDNETNSKEYVKGIVKLIYNGKNVVITRPTDETTEKPIVTTSATTHKLLPTATTKRPTTKAEAVTTPKEKYDYSKIPKSYMDKFVEEYFKRFSETIESKTGKPKRPKRNIQTNYDTENTTPAPKTKKKDKNDDDELYVEIETNFDSKGIKGEKKKKLISGLVEKIQNALHSVKIGGKHEKRKHLHVKKRLQDPLDFKTLTWVDKILPLNGIFHRELSPITNLVANQDVVGASEGNWKKGYVGYVTNHVGEEWKKPYLGPGFLNAAKSLNSAEMGEVNIDYHKVLDINGIPQRLQKPLNTENSEEMLGSTYQDIGNLKFYIKNIDGTGLSVGFNQYSDVPPDPDSIKLFTGLENVVKAYHEAYDDNTELNTDYTKEKNHEPLENQHNDHTIVRRSIQEEFDYHLNKYKFMYDKNFLPYESYEEILKKPKNVERNTNEKALTIDENIFEKKLKPAEIFGLANFFQRNKRSMKVQKYLDTNSKMKVNRYLNIQTLPRKHLFTPNKRNKRQINKIRIIASDMPERHANDNIFVVSDENVFADRALVRDFNRPAVNSEVYRRKHIDQEEYVPFYEELATSHPSIFSSRSRHNALSSKYPHMFMEEITKSKEDELSSDNVFISKIFPNHHSDGRIDDFGDINGLNSSDNDPQIKQYLNSIPAKYKVTVKFTPKNGSGLRAGFKEVHTSINKSYNKNGLLYSSLVNVSEISKIVNLNKTKDSSEHEAGTLPAPVFVSTVNPIQEQQEKMKLLLNQHKQHIDDQLEHLKNERSKLDIVLVQTNNYTNNQKEYMDLVMSSNPSQDIQLTENEIAKAISASAIEYTTTNEPITNKPNIERSSQTQPIENKLNPILIDSIVRNENLTHQVLNKIEKNTQMLQEFLRRLTEHIPITKPIEEYVKTVPLLPKEWKPHPIPNFEPNAHANNDSHVAIPFVYAYQSPIPSNKVNTDNLASVVYHGHIHTNTILNQNFKKQSEISDKVVMPKHEVNQSRFFIDNLMAADRPKIRV